MCIKLYSKTAILIKKNGRLKLEISFPPQETKLSRLFPQMMEFIRRDTT